MTPIIGQTAEGKRVRVGMRAVAPILNYKFDEEATEEKKVGDEGGEKILNGTFHGLNYNQSCSNCQKTPGHVKI